MAIFKFKNQNGNWEVIESPGAVKYIEQNLSDVEKEIARNNIGAYVERTVLLNGNASSCVFPEDSAPADFDLIFIQFSSSQNGPGSTAIFDPQASYAVPTISCLNMMNGAVEVAYISGMTNTTKGSSISITALSSGGSATLPKFYKIIGYKFKKKGA